MRSLTAISSRRRSRVATALASGAGALVATLLAGGAQAVTPPEVLLGTAGQFAVLAGSGITNTGATMIGGDSGSSPTSSETGFAGCPAADCVTQTGVNHASADPNDATTRGAKAALATAYIDAAGRTQTTVVTELAGQTLVAGVYSSASGTFGMSGTLILDGENNADAVFIFQTASTLITGGTGNITLTRGPRPAISSGRSAARQRSARARPSAAQFSRTTTSHSATASRSTAVFSPEPSPPAPAPSP